MALIPQVIGEILAIDDPSPIESLNAYYTHKVTLRVTGIGRYSDLRSHIGEDIAVFVPRRKLGEEGKQFPFTVGQTVSAIVFGIDAGWEAEGFRLVSKAAGGESL